MNEELKLANCPVCGTKCKIVGKTTMHYEPATVEINALGRERELTQEELVKIISDSMYKNVPWSFERIAMDVLEAMRKKRESE